MPLSLSALASIPGQPLLTTLAGAFLLLSPQQLLSPEQAAALPLLAASALAGGVGRLDVEGQLNGASIILGNIKVSAGRRPPASHSFPGSVGVLCADDPHIAACVCSMC